MKVASERRLRILQVSTANRGGGAEGSAWNLFNAYRERGHSSWLAVGRKSTDDPNVVEIPNEAQREHWTRFWTELAATRSVSALARLPGFRHAPGLLRWLADPRRNADIRLGREDFHWPGTRALLELAPEKPDLIHCHNLHDNYFDLRVLPTLSQKLPVILNLRDDWLLTGHCAYSLECQRWESGCGKCPDLSRYPSIRRDGTASNWARKKRIYQRGRYFITAPSEWLMARARRSMLRGLDYRVIPNGIDLTIFRPGDQSAARAQLGLNPDAKIVLFAAWGGSENPYKDGQTMRAAIQRLLAERQRERLLFVSLGEKQPQPQQESMYFVPHESEPCRVALYYQAADIYIHAAKAESFGKSVTEAMASGRPVVATAVGGIPEQIRHGETGFLTAAGDAEAMAKHIDILLEREDLRRSFSQAALAEARRRFDLRLQVDNFLAWYREILDRFSSDKGGSHHNLRNGRTRV